MFLSQLLRISA